MIYPLLMLFVYLAGIFVFPILVNHIGPVSRFVKDVNYEHISYKDYKNYLTVLSVFWIIALIGAFGQYGWGKFSDFAAKSTGFNPPKPPATPCDLSQTTWSHRSGQGWTIGDYKQALNALEKQTDELHGRVELLEKIVSYDGPKPGDIVNGTLIGRGVD